MKQNLGRDYVLACHQICYFVCLVINHSEDFPQLNQTMVKQFKYHWNFLVANLHFTIITVIVTVVITEKKIAELRIIFMVIIISGVRESNFYQCL